MSTDNSPPHAGHRARMRSRYFETGLTGFQPHEMLELILYCAIPKRDVNPLAHQLIDRFGSIDAVLSASEEELMSVPGVGQKTCDLLRSLDAVCNHYKSTRLSGARTLTCVGDVLHYALPACRSAFMSELIVLYEDRCGVLLTVRAYPSRLRDPEVLRDVIGAALSLHACSVILLLKGFEPLRRPSKTELDDIRQMIGSLSAIDVYTLDCIMRSGDHVFSLRKEGLLVDEHILAADSSLRWRSWLGPLVPLAAESGWYHIDPDEL